MTRNEIEQSLKNFFVETLEIEAAILQPDASLKNDVGLTSMDMVDIRLFVEKTFGWVMTREDAMRVNTLSDLYSAIEMHAK